MPFVQSCYSEARRLRQENQNQGALYWAGFTPKGIAEHCYYVPDEHDLDAIARNHADNGFGRFPRLTVRDLLKYGIRLG